MSYPLHRFAVRNFVSRSRNTNRERLAPSTRTKRFLLEEVAGKSGKDVSEEDGDGTEPQRKHSAQEGIPKPKVRYRTVFPLRT